MLKYVAEEIASVATNITGYAIIITDDKGIVIGADSEAETKSVKKQIEIYFLMAAVPALISSIFAVWAMLTNFLHIPYGTTVTEIAGLCAIVLAVFVGFEFLYIGIVKKSSGFDD